MLTTLTQEYLKKKVHYNPETGVFTWLWVFTRGKHRTGFRAGSLSNKHGYRSIVIDGVAYKEHRLAWLYVYGHWPDNILDHINGDRADNRISNIRLATRKLNAENRRNPITGHSTGFMGVVWRGRLKKYEARIHVDKKYVYLGLYDTPEAAHAAYLCAKRAEHEGCTI